ncbi:MAG TPA: SgcJ/EcaC family oxidoreductase [Solirubrobacteraceae bacterium]|nr:SgcJ/EcaC family oxidoreductase [Solirubrobacteraceae bacterium]
MTPRTDVRAVAERYVAAAQAADKQALEELFAADATWTLAAGNLPIAGTWRGREAVLNDFLAVALSRYQPGSIELEVTRTIAEGDQVVMQWTSRARTHSGQPYENECIGVFTIRDGRIRAVREYMDTLYARDHAFGEPVVGDVRQTTVLSALQDGNLAMDDLTEGVVFHSPVTDYHGREDVAHVLSTIAIVLDTVSAHHQVACDQGVLTNITAWHAGSSMTGMVSEVYDDDGRVRETTLLLRPLRVLGAAIGGMQAALERSPLPSRTEPMTQGEPR